MKIAELLEFTRGDTNVVIDALIENRNHLMRVWEGKVDDIDFYKVPYGLYEVEHISVAKDEDILIIQFEYPELNDSQKKYIGELSLEHPELPTSWIEHIYIKYTLDIVEEILQKSRNDVYKEIKIQYLM